MREQIWRLNVAFTEEGDRTRADAILELASTTFHGSARPSARREIRAFP